MLERSAKSCKCVFSKKEIRLNKVKVKRSDSTSQDFKRYYQCSFDFSEIFNGNTVSALNSLQSNEKEKSTNQEKSGNLKNAKVWLVNA